jgi:ABC-type Fe3+/spermidine/putrescine transport system ATPase subunit
MRRPALAQQIGTTAVPAAAPPLIEIQDLRLSFGPTAALDGITLAIAPGEFVTLLGPSGSGKTTLLRTIAGFLQPDAGDVRVAGRSVLNDPPERRPVNTVFQHYALFPHLNVAKNVSFGLEVRGEPRSEIPARVQRVLTMVRLEGFERRRVDQLSGGQRQRVALARALVNQPQVLLLDEPLGALDLKLRREMQLELRTLQRELDLTFVYVTHDQEEALVLSDRIAVMHEGRIVQFGTPTDVYDRPRSRFVAEFIGETNLLRGQASNGHVSLHDLPLQFPMASVREGPVLLSLRPHAIQVGGHGALKTDATIADRVFLGSDTRLALRVGPGLLTAITRRPPAELPNIGDLVQIAWEQDDLSVIDE